MKRLTNEQVKTKNELATSLSTVAEQIRREIQIFNTALSESIERIRCLEEQYEALVETANGFAESIHDAQEAYIDERSETWASSDNGDMYRDWANEWQLSLEAIEVELPDELEEPDFDDLNSFRDLPDHP